MARICLRRCAGSSAEANERVSNHEAALSRSCDCGNLCLRRIGDAFRFRSISGITPSLRIGSVLSLSLA